MGGAWFLRLAWQGGKFAPFPPASCSTVAGLRCILSLYKNRLWHTKPAMRL